MEKSILKHIGVTVCVLFVCACAGEDYMPVYFPQKNVATDETPVADEPPAADSSASGSCVVHLDSSLCISLKADTVSVGVDGAEPLCADLDPIPIEVVNGTSLILRGNTFPDIPFEGHGLPAPIVINAKGSSDGTGNVGTGKIDSAGNITIEGFSLYINALGMVGEVPDLTFTTGTPEEVDGITNVDGEPLAANGEVKLIATTVIGHLFPAADEKLYGASLMGVFDGTITPSLSECKGGDSKPQSTFVTKIVLDGNGKQTEAILPGSTRMELPAAFIAEGAPDVGPDFESSAKFKIINATSKALKIDLPALIGPFSIESVSGGNLKQDLPPKTPLVLKVVFRPNSKNVDREGEIAEMLTIGTDVYQLTASAQKRSGQVSLNINDEEGAVSQAKDSLKIGNVMVSATLRRDFFTCGKITCDGVEKPTACVPCVDVLLNVCQLMTVDKDGNPMGAVDKNCAPVNAGAKDSFTPGISGQAISPVNETVTVKNSGVKELTIRSIKIEEYQGSRSKGQFKVSLNRALPYTMAPSKMSEGDTIRAVVVYEPTDLIGFDGTEALVGRPVKDRAVLRVVSDEGNRSIELSGITTVKETPSLEVFFKSATGTKGQTDGSEFAFRGITMETSDLAAPVFIKLSDSAASSIRVSKIVSDDARFEWLDSREKINAKPEGSRCSIPVFDPNGGLTGTITDLNPVSLLPNGFDLNPGAYTTDNMPLFGCINYHMGAEKKRQNKGKLTITTIEIGRDGKPLRNADGSMKQTDYTVNLLAVINPIKGKIVFRLTQTMAAVMNPQFASISAAASKKEMDWQVEDGLAIDSDRFVMPGALILDPFDEETIYDEKGKVMSVPGDGVTMIYRKVDTHPTSNVYEDSLLPDYTSLLYDSLISEGDKGAFFDYPNVPEDLRSGSLRIYTASLSYPGPIAKPEDRPETLRMCQEVDPCSEEGQRMHGEGPTDPSKKGVCAFFFASAGSWDSPAMRYSGDMAGGERKNLCKAVGEDQRLNDLKGTYTLDGSVNIPDIGLRLWGPNYFNNPVSPLGGAYPPMDAVFHMAFTSDVLMPSKDDNAQDLLPDKRINTSRMEHKINLTDATLETPRLCEAAVKNRLIRGEYYSTWKYLAPFLVKDEEGTAPAGCPEPGNSFNGGSAFLRGRPVDQDTGITTLVGTAKFESDNNLTFAFKDVMFFIVLNGWFCDPAGEESKMEGSHCYDKNFNDRDGLSTVGITE